jgi:hypothetical protein
MAKKDRQGQGDQARPDPDGRRDARPQWLPGDAHADPRRGGNQAYPVIVCTSKGQETDKIWGGLRQGAVDYLVNRSPGRTPATHRRPALSDMARKSSLRDFQTYLAGRLSDAAQGQGGASWLGLEIGDDGWLIDLAMAGGKSSRRRNWPGCRWSARGFSGIANVRRQPLRRDRFCPPSSVPGRRREKRQCPLVAGWVRHGSKRGTAVCRACWA